VEVRDVGAAAARGPVTDDPPAAQLDDAVGDSADLAVVGHDEDRPPVAGLPTQELQDGDTGPACSA